MLKVSIMLMALGSLAADPRVIYVDNTASDWGNGTYSKPYNTLRDAETASGPGDTLFILVGDGTTYGMDQGIVLKDNQVLIGSGFPQITNSNGPAVELANYNQVTGLHIEGADSWGIHGAGINGAFIANNSINNSQNNGGIGIFNGSGTIQITKTTLNGAGGNTVGIHIESSGYTATNALLQWNIIDNVESGIQIYGYKNSSIVSEISFNDISSTTTVGIDVESLDQNVSTTSILNNTVHDNYANGILTFSRSNLHTTALNNVVSNNAKEGMVASTSSMGHQVCFLEQNAFESNGGVGGFYAHTSLNLLPGDVLCLHLNKNSSDTGYQLTNYLGDSFYYEVPNTNVGTVHTTGIIKQVGPGYCQ